jgi:hypothetical protein
MENETVRIGTETLLETDYYVAELIDYTDQKQDGTPLMSNPYSAEEEAVPQWRFTWEIDHEGEAITLSSWVNKPVDPNDVSPRSNLAKMVAALLPNHAAVDWTVDTLLHERCRLQVELGTKQDGSKVNRVKGYHPLKAPAARATPAARQPAAAAAREPVPTVAQRRASAAVVDPRVEEEEAPPF